MAGFRMCARCQAEYDDPGNRRFHAQPNACPDCGPSLKLLRADGSPEQPGGGPLAAALEALLAGRIVAVKGVGGYHLACLAGDPGAVAELRSRKHREDKPFALHGGLRRGRGRPGACSARASARCSSGAERPIVLAPRLPGGGGCRRRRAGRPRAGRHAPLLAAAPPAARRCRGTAGDDQRQRLGRADLPTGTTTRCAAARAASPTCCWSTTGRSTPAPTTRSSALRRADRGRPLMLRRSRGFVPAAVPAARRRAPGRSWPAAPSRRTPSASPRASAPGSATTSATSRTTRRCARSPTASSTSSACSRSTPEMVAHDLHPEYLSTKYALEREGVEPLGVQHHHAHLAAVPGRARRARPRASGRSSTARGYGTDGTIWGGELLVGDLAGFRAGGPPAGGADAGRRPAIRQPWRMACAWLDAARRAAPPRRRWPRSSRTHLGAGARALRIPSSARRRPPAWAGCSMRSPRCAACGPR